MGVNRFLHVCALTLAFSAAAAVPVLAQNPSHASIKSFQDKLDNFDLQVQKLTRDLEATQSSRQSMEERLKQSQRDLKNKEADLQQLRLSLGDNPSPVQSEALANEQQRIALAEINIKSVMATIIRLERKEEELKAALLNVEEQKRDTRQRITKAEQRARQQADAEAKAIAAELDALKRENERLRMAMEEEARRAQEAAAEAQRLAELAAQQEQERLAQQVLATEQSAAVNTNPSQGAIGDEPPVYLGDDGVEVVIRSRSIDAPVVMQAVGPNLYQAEVSVDPGTAYFDVRKQRFRGYFPESVEQQKLIFIYNTSGENPTFSVISGDSGPENPQMISDSNAPF